MVRVLLCVVHIYFNIFTLVIENISIKLNFINILFKFNIDLLM